MWRALRNLGYPINSTWIDEAGPGETSDMGKLWERITVEVQEAKGVVAYLHKEDMPFKGSLIEIGMALGQGKPVAVVLSGFSKSDGIQNIVGSWIYHPNITIHTRMTDAFVRIQK